MTDLSVYVGTGHLIEVDERPKSLVGLDLPGILDVTASLRKMVDQRLDVCGRINSSVRTWRRNSSSFLGSPIASANSSTIAVAP
jgi:hypothetical protein